MLEQEYRSLQRLMEIAELRQKGIQDTHAFQKMGVSKLPKVKELSEEYATVLEQKKGLLKKSLSKVASVFRHWLQKTKKKRLQPVEVAAVL